jgi:hypothetical protein
VDPLARFVQNGWLLVQTVIGLVSAIPLSGVVARSGTESLRFLNWLQKNTQPWFCESQYTDKIRLLSAVIPLSNLRNMIIPLDPNVLPDHDDRPWMQETRIHVFCRDNAHI